MHEFAILVVNVVLCACVWGSPLAGDLGEINYEQLIF